MHEHETKCCCLISIEPWLDPAFDLHKINITSWWKMCRDKGGLNALIDPILRGSATSTTDLYQRPIEDLRHSQVSTSNTPSL